MKYDAIQRAKTSYLEYVQIVEGKRRDREYLNAQTRLICFYNTTGKDKHGRKLTPADLWPIGDEIGRGNAVNDSSLQSDTDLREYGKRKGIRII